MDTVTDMDTATDIIVAAIRIAIITPAMATVMGMGMVVGAAADTAAMAVATTDMIADVTMGGVTVMDIAGNRLSRISN